MVDQVGGVVAITELYTNTATVSTVVYSLPNNSTTPAAITTDGVFQIWIDLSAMAANDEYEILVLEKCTSAGSQLAIMTVRMIGTVGTPQWVAPTFILMHGWDVTMQRIAGSDRSFTWSIRQVA